MELGVEVEAGEVGFDAGRLARIDRHFARYVEDGRLPGWLVLVSRRGRIVHLSTCGWRNLEANLPVEADTRFRIYSMTKPITAVAAMQLYEEGAFALKDPVQRFIPSFADVPIEAGWGGPINVSGLNLPFFGTNGGGNVHHALGYTGNGVGPSHLGGRILAALATHEDDDLTRLAIVTREPKRFPPEPIRSPGVLFANEAIRRKDDLEDAGRWVSPLTRAVAGLPRKLGFNLGPTTW